MSALGTVWGNVRGVWAVLRPPERRRWLALIPLGALAAGLEVLCAGAIFTLVGALTGPPAGPVAGALAAVGLGGLGSLALATGVLFLAKTGVAVALIHANHRAVEHGRAAVAGRLFAGALDAPWTLHLERGVAEAAHDLLGRAGAAFDDVVWPAAQLAVNGVTAAALVGLLLAVAPGITLAVGAALVAWLAAVHRLSRRFADRAGQAEDRAQREGLQAVWQTLGALREIRALGREGFFQARFEATQAALVRARYVRATLAGLPRVWTETLFVLLMLGVVFALHDAADPTAAFSLLGLCAYVALRLLPLANGSLWLLGRIRWGTPAVQRLVADHGRLADPPGWQRRPPPPVTGPVAVAVEGLRFAWPEGPPVLDGAALAVAPGEAVAVVGPTGAGKSTLLHLLAGLLRPTAGEILADGE
ncbi:MAG: ABC transporter ATP-binding protein, partial [Myxococcales bacterium]|nr:ABC transporter ATP-binding protein [Myxococcales bacterium]